jgi:tetratricopeptide (TPR) repeat protein
MYRDAPLSGPACYKHAAAPAAAHCEHCTRALCEPCIVYDVSRHACIDCARRARRRRTVGAVAKIGGALAALAGGVTFMLTRPQPFDYGADAPKIAQLHNKVAAERCDKRATLEYEDALVAAGDFRGALGDSDAFFARCGDWYRLRWVRYTAHEQLSEHAAAAAEATKLIAHDPQDHDYPWWRGLAYEEMGRVDDAIRDYRRTLELLPSADRIPFNLSNLLEQKQQFCAAREPIRQFLRYYPALVDKPGIVDRLERLTLLGHCPE